MIDFRGYPRNHRFLGVPQKSGYPQKCHFLGSFLDPLKSPFLGYPPEGSNICPFLSLNSGIPPFRQKGGQKSIILGVPKMTKYPEKREKTPVMTRFWPFLAIFGYFGSVWPKRCFLRSKVWSFGTSGKRFCPKFLENPENHENRCFSTFSKKSLKIMKFWGVPPKSTILGTPKITIFWGIGRMGRYPYLKGSIWPDIGSVHRGRARDPPKGSKKGSKIDHFGVIFDTKNDPKIEHF